jgi:hypothetical protein
MALMEIKIESHIALDRKIAKLLRKMQSTKPDNMRAQTKLIVGIALSVLGVLAYGLLDSRVTIDHLSQSLEKTEREKAATVKMLQLSLEGKERNSVEIMIRRTYPEELVKNFTQHIEAGDLVFRFEKGKLVSIDTLVNI